MAENRKKLGRPQTPINWGQFEELCAIQCTITEIAGVFKCDIDTIMNRVKAEYGATFSEVFERYRAPGFVSLRRSMFKSAIHKGSDVMMKHLSKNYLGMSDKIEQKVEMSGEIQTSSIGMGDVQKMMSDPVAKKLSLELAERMLELDQKENADEVSKKDKTR